MRQKIKTHWENNYWHYLYAGLILMNITIAVTLCSCWNWMSYMSAGFSFGCWMWHGFYKRSSKWRDDAIKRYQDDWATHWDEQVKLREEIIELKTQIQELENGKPL